MNQQQLQARLFSLEAKHGIQFALGYTQHIMQSYGKLAWVICCGAEMLLRNQLPERAQSLSRKPGETVQMAIDRRAVEDLARDGDPFFNPLGLTTQEQAQARNAMTQCQDGTWW